MCIKALIAFGADLHQTNDNRKTALDIAQEDSIEGKKVVLLQILSAFGGEELVGLACSTICLGNTTRNTTFAIVLFFF